MGGHKAIPTRIVAALRARCCAAEAVDGITFVEVNDALSTTHIDAGDADARKPWITPEIKELAGAQNAQGGRNVGR